MIKSPAKKQGILYLSDGRNLAASAFRCYPAPAARMVGGFASSCEAKAPLRQKLHPPPILNEPLPLLDIIQLQRLESPVISLSHEAKSASRSRAPMPCDSERAASAFRYYPVPVASSSHLRTSRTKGKSTFCAREP